jgi:hypothetical protein
MPALFFKICPARRSAHLNMMPSQRVEISSSFFAARSCAPTEHRQHRRHIRCRGRCKWQMRHQPWDYSTVVNPGLALSQPPMPWVPEPEDGPVNIPAIAPPAAAHQQDRRRATPGCGFVNFPAAVPTDPAPPVLVRWRQQPGPEQIAGARKRW